MAVKPLPPIITGFQVLNNLVRHNAGPHASCRNFKQHSSGSRHCNGSHCNPFWDHHNAVEDAVCRKCTAYPWEHQQRTPVPSHRLANAWVHAWVHAWVLAWVQVLVGSWREMAHLGCRFRATNAALFWALTKMKHLEQ